MLPRAKFFRDLGEILGEFNFWPLRILDLDLG